VDLTALFLNYEPPGQETLPPSDVADFDAPRSARRVDRLGQEKALELVALYIEGLSVSQLAAQYGVNITTVRNQLKAAEVEMRPIRELSPQQSNNNTRCASFMLMAHLSLSWPESSECRPAPSDVCWPSPG
jgi:transposase-like protein